MPRPTKYAKQIVAAWPAILEAVRSVGVQYDLLASIAKVEGRQLKRWITEKRGHQGKHGAMIRDLDATEAEHQLKVQGIALSNPNTAARHLAATSEAWMTPSERRQHRENERSNEAIAAQVVTGLKRVDALTTKCIGRDSALGKLGPDAPKDLLEAQAFALWAVANANKDLVRQWREEHGPYDASNSMFILHANDAALAELQEALRQNLEVGDEQDG